MKKLGGIDYDGMHPLLEIGTRRGTRHWQTYCCEKSTPGLNAFLVYLNEGMRILA